MKFEVKYFLTCTGLPPSGLNFQGKGWIFINDTALICKGNIPKLDLGGLSLTSLDKKILRISTTRTVPYATIIKYKKPRVLCKTHKITYRLPNGKKVSIKFQITKSRYNEMFTSQLEEYLVVAQSFVSS